MKATSIIPSILYEDATAAIEWLCNAFGFEKHLIVPGEDGIIVHAQLTLGDIMIMIGSAQRQSEYTKLIKQPNEIGNFETQSPYIVLAENDMEAHYEKAKAHGAKIVIHLKEEDYGGKNYSCYDPEGHLWNFGSYDPWNTTNK
ncbi:MAG: VOC family protein [Chitinophagaceae bacterium]|nr:VOC family protein [Chitinophagaceae bacterium]